MEKSSLIGAAVLAGSSLAAASSACEVPSMVEVPDGETATTDEMVQARNAVTEYLAAMESYLACIDEEIEAEGDDAPEEFEALMIQRHNAAVSEMETVAAAFNEQLRAFQSGESGEGSEE